MKLRILSVGRYLAHDDIANHDFENAPAFFDFDVIVIDPECVSELWKGQTEKQEGYEVIKWDSRTGGGTSTETFMLRRLAEMSRFLSSGRLLICILRTPAFVYVRQYYDDTPDPKEPKRWLHRYSWLPLATIQGLAGYLRVGEGTNIKLVDAGNAFSPYFKAFDEQLYFECYLGHTDKIEIESRLGVKHLHEIALTHGGTPAAFSFEHMGGQLAFLPPAKTQDPEKLAGVLLECIQASVGSIEESIPPAWVSDCKPSLPQLSELEKQLQECTTRLEAVRKEQENILEQKTGREKYLKLLYEKGKFQLEPVVRDAFSLLGFQVTQPGDFDALLDANGASAIVEIEGKDNKAIDIDKYRQLFNYVVDDQQSSEVPKKGILVSNGFRFKDPKEREEQFTKHVIDAAVGSHYCLLTTEVLFHLVCKVLDNPQEELKQEIRKHIMATDGLFNL